MSRRPLDAGPELDAHVARALGWDFTVNADGDVELLDTGYAFEPSREIEVAMEAAECFGLWKCRPNVGPPEIAVGLVCKADGKWYVVNFVNEVAPDLLTMYATFSGRNPGVCGAPTPEVAVCRAIDYLASVRRN